MAPEHEPLLQGFEHLPTLLSAFAEMQAERLRVKEKTIASLCLSLSFAVHRPQPGFPSLVRDFAGYQSSAVSLRTATGAVAVRWQQQ
ncbi:hypothetical protein DM860_009471 [Cuscuta australis]|uniref:Uncharacterized protein n=1 Tax=Cuscuta australis TaxID=267555 RepID=A0A328DJ16_9ASTE|nr:hypothetical protein DM860_009471 [Cuscuta australis]